MKTHEELMGWLASDSSNVHRFLKTIDRLVGGRVVLVFGDDDALITGFLADRRHRRGNRQPSPSC